MGINENSKTKHAEDIARMVFAFVSSAEGFVDSIDEGDDLKLLRLRTRKNEIVIVPGIQIIPLPFPFQCVMNSLICHRRFPIPASSHTRFPKALVGYKKNKAQTITRH